MSRTLLTPLIALLIASAFASRAAAAEDTSATQVDAQQAARDALIVETVLRLDAFDLNSSAKAKAAVLRYLAAHRGSMRFFELIERFSIREAAGDLLGQLLADPTSTAGVASARLLLKLDKLDGLKKTLVAADEQGAVAVVTALGLLGGKQSSALLTPLVTDDDRPLAVRSAAVRAVGRNLPGQRQLLAMVVAKKLSADLNFAAADVLLASRDQGIRAESSKHLKLPAGAAGKPLPPIAELLRRRGDARRGMEVFRTTGTCAKCHVVGDHGKEVGPNLSEIGGKLAPDAMFVSILDPSAGISHNYETYAVALEDGTLVTGVLVSQTPQLVTIKTAESIVRTFKEDEIDELVKQKTSLMPADLQKTMTAEQLVDVVAYLKTLKKQGE